MNGFSIAAGALGKALADAFRGQLEGEEAARKISAQEFEKGQALRKERMEQTLFPVQYQQAGLQRDLAAQQLSEAKATADARRRTAVAGAQSAEAGAQRDIFGLADVLKRQKAEADQAETAAEQARYALEFGRTTKDPAELKNINARTALVEQQAREARDKFARTEEAYRRLPEAVSALSAAAGDPEAEKIALVQYGHILEAIDHPMVKMYVEALRARAGLAGTAFQIESAARADATRLANALFGPPRGFDDEGRFLAEEWFRLHQTAIKYRQMASSIPGLTIPGVPEIPDALKEQFASSLLVQKGGVFGRIAGVWNTLLYGNTDLEKARKLVRRAEPYLRQGWDFQSAFGRALAEQEEKVPPTKAAPAPSPSVKPAESSAYGPVPERPAPTVPPESETEALLEVIDNTALEIFKKPWRNLTKEQQKKVLEALNPDTPVLAP